MIKPPWSPQASHGLPCGAPVLPQDPAIPPLLPKSDAKAERRRGRGSRYQQWCIPRLPLCRGPRSHTPSPRRGGKPVCPQVRGDRRAFAFLPAGGCPHTPLQRPWALPARSGPSSPRPRSPQGEAGAAAVLPPPLPALAGPVRAVPPYHRRPSPSTTNFWA